MKPFTVLAALASGRWHQDSLIPTAPDTSRSHAAGAGPAHGHDHASAGAAEVEQVAIAKVALDLEPRAVFDVLSRVGMGVHRHRPAGESLGTLTTRGSRTRGSHHPGLRYGLALSPLHLTRLSHLASGGLRMPLTILRQTERRTPSG